MNRKTIALLWAVTTLSPAFATEGLPLCAPPLAPECVDPKWGLINPDTLEADAGATSTMGIRAAAVDAPIAVRLMPVEMQRGTAGPPATARLKAVVDATQRFARETAALTAAIRRARFDKQGNLVQGEAQIAAAAEAARKVPPEFALTLYVKAPARLDDAHREVIANKLAAINGILVRVNGRR